MSDFQQVTAESPCEVCGKPDWCQRGAGYIQCMRHDEHPMLGPGTETEDSDGNGFWYWRENSPESAKQEFCRNDSQPSCETSKSKADDEILNRVYSAYLKESVLLYAHIQKLVKRGLTLEEANKLSKSGYGSQQDNSRKVSVRKIIKNGISESDIGSTPGFHIVDHEGNKYWTSSRLVGMLIPARNCQGQVVAVQCRLDQPNSDGKYKIFSSKKRGGSSPGSPVHFPLFEGDTSTVRITEGYLKADIATLKTGILTIGLPSVGGWKKAAKSAASIQAKTVLIAYDADHQTNENVRRSLVKLVNSLRDDFTVKLELWNDEFDSNSEIKGIDDLVLSGNSPNTIEGEELENYITNLVLMDEKESEEKQQIADNTIRNGETIYDEDGNADFLPFSMAEILENIDRLTNNGIKRVESALFIKSPDEGTISWLMNTDSMVGWLGSITGSPPEFKRRADAHSAAHVYQELKRTAESYLAVESLPHEPPMQGHFYACKSPEPGDGSMLNELVSRYNPETEIDGDLIKAAFVTPFCGLAGGHRPSFLIAADSGRGSGKTTLASHIGHLAGGTIDLSAGEDAGQMKQRLLSSEGLAKRVSVLDNVKSNKFGWAEFEAMITAPTISGKRMYHGEASRPNNLLWIITLNGPSLSKDIAQRCVIIKVTKPKRSGTWAEETRQFIDDHREAIIADCIGFLRSERSELNQYSRWASWERAVLERLPEPADAQAVILDRQKQADVEDEESGLVEDHFASKLKRYKYDPESCRVFIPSKLCTEWYCEIMNERLTTTAVSRKLKQSIGEGLFKSITNNTSNSNGRGFIWWGKEAVFDAELDDSLQDRIDQSTEVF